MIAAVDLKNDESLSKAIAFSAVIESQVVYDIHAGKVKKAGIHPPLFLKHF
jgi:hypothetical protein